MLSRRQLVALLYAASGAAALVYEVTWTRQLTLLMGHTVAAASTVLAAVMGGLAAGSWIGGRFERRLSASSSPLGATRLRSYAALELLVAISAIALPLLLAAFSPLLAWAYNDGSTPLRFGIVRLGLSIAALAVPTMAMGATFPIAAAWLANTDVSEPKRRTGSHAGKSRPARLASVAAADVGGLYAANTAGAATGALAAGLWLIPAIGVHGTIWIGILLNVGAAAGAFWLATHEGTRSSDTSPAVEGERETRKKTQRVTADGSTGSVVPAPLTGCIAAAVSGTVALVLEVAWTRLLALVIGPTTYAFTIVVAAFIIGIALGASGGARLVRRSDRPSMWLSGMLAIAGVTASMAGWFAASRLPLIVASQVGKPDATFGWVVSEQAFGIVLLLLPMTCALGAAFPLALAMVSVKRSTVGSDLARVYASNTVGAICGALAAGFVLLPQVGLHNTFRVAALTALAAALGIWALAPGGVPLRRRRPLVVAVAGLAAVMGVVLPNWDLSLLASGAYKYAPYMQQEDLETELRAWHLLFYKDGAAATVGVREFAGMRSLVIDGKVDASNMGDMLTQQLLGLLPVLLHPNPQRACVIGLGSGVTAAATLATGTVKHTDVIEISPEVVQASSFFRAENRGLLERPEARVIIGDGRSHLRLTKQKYDVIVSEPSNPWMAGIAALFTREFFEEARGCLNPNGIVCQWAHTYDIRPEDLQSIVRTFASVFPQSTMWLVGEGDLLLIGTNGSAIDLSGIQARWRQGEAPKLLESVAIDGRAAPFALLSLFQGGPAEMAKYGNGSVVQRDDRMSLEFSAPRAIYGGKAADNSASIRDLAGPNGASAISRKALADATDADWTVAGAMELKADAHRIAYDRFRRALQLNSRNAQALAGLTDAAGGAHLEPEARALLESLAHAEPGNAEVRIELSRLLATGGDTELAASAATDAVRLAPDDPGAADQLASVYADAGDAVRLAPVASALAARFPNHEKSLYYNATLQVLTGHAADAIQSARTIVARNPRDSRAQNLLGVACASTGQRDCALAAFRAALAANPRDPATYVNLGVLEMQSSDPEAAASYFTIAVTLDRASAPAREGLAQAQAALAGKP